MPSERSNQGSWSQERREEAEVAGVQRLRWVER